jgi:hypothetical protein
MYLHLHSGLFAHRCPWFFFHKGFPRSLCLLKILDFCSHLWWLLIKLLAIGAIYSSWWSWMAYVELAYLRHMLMIWWWGFITGELVVEIPQILGSALDLWKSWLGLVLIPTVALSLNYQRFSELPDFAESFDFGCQLLAPVVWSTAPIRCGHMMLVPSWESKLNKWNEECTENRLVTF